MRVCWHTNFFHDAWVIQLNVNHLKPWDSVLIVSQVNFTTMKDPSTGFARLPERYHYGCFQLVPATGNPWKPTRLNESVVGTSEIFEQADWFTKLPTGSFELKKWSRFTFSIWRIKFQQKKQKQCVSIFQNSTHRIRVLSNLPAALSLPTQLGFQPRWNHPKFWPKAPGRRLRWSREGGAGSGLVGIFVAFFFWFLVSSPIWKSLVSRETKGHLKR